MPSQVRVKKVLGLNGVARLPAIDTPLGEFNDAVYGRAGSEQVLAMIETPFQSENSWYTYTINLDGNGGLLVLAGLHGLLTYADMLCRHASPRSRVLAQPLTSVGQDVAIYAIAAIDTTPQLHRLSGHVTFQSCHIAWDEQSAAT